MKNFSSFIRESYASKTLTVFDVDDTLFKTDSRVKITKNGKVVKTLLPGEFNTYKLTPDEEYDFSEFRDAKFFKKNARPVDNMVEKAKSIISSERSGSKTIIITARSTFTDRKIFASTFADHGINIPDENIETAGSLDLGSTAKNKRFIFHKYLSKGVYDKVRFFDDAPANINSFLALAKKYPKTKFEAWLVLSDGSIKKVTG